MIIHLQSEHPFKVSIQGGTQLPEAARQRKRGRNGKRLDDLYHVTIVGPNGNTTINIDQMRESEDGKRE